MTDEEHFRRVLTEIVTLIEALFRFGLYDSTVLIGAQVVALEQRARGKPVFEITLPTGPKLLRPFSMEPDLVFDTEDLQKLEILPEAMRAAGFERVLRAAVLDAFERVT